MNLQSIFEALESKAPKGAQYQDRSDANLGPVLPDNITVNNIKDAGKGVAAGTVGLGGDIESIARLLVQARGGYLAPELNPDTFLPTTDEVGTMMGADIESDSFVGGSFFGLDPVSKFMKGVGLAMPLIARIGKNQSPTKAIQDALLDSNKIKPHASGGFDPRTDPRVGSKERLDNLTIQTEGERAPLPEVSLEDYEGRGIITTMSDMTSEGPPITHIKGVPLVRKVGRHGGQGFGSNPQNILEGNAWKSALTPINSIQHKAEILKRQTGKNPLLAPWKMAPSGSDFSLSTGDAMLTFAASNMDKATKADLDKAIKEYVTIGGWTTPVKDDAGKIIKPKKRKGHNLKMKGFKSVDDPNMFEVWSKQPFGVRTEIKNMMDKQFRNRGGLGIGEARIAIADNEQLLKPDSSLINLSELHPDRPITIDPNPSSYPANIRGEILGSIKEPNAKAYQLLPNAEKQRNLTKKRVREGTVMDINNPHHTDVRALQMNSFGGILDDEILRRIKG